jgi:hypothetical protein
MAHVRSEMRRVYVSARGARLTKHAAYIGAAKALLKKACTCEYDETNYVSTCRFHERDTRWVSNFPNSEPIEEDHGLVYYHRVMPRLVRFLKFVDAHERTRS